MLLHIRIKSDALQRYSYMKSFMTSGEWETIKIPFSIFMPIFRGNEMNMPNYPAQFMEEIALLIGKKRKENFSLEISNIYLE